MEADGKETSTYLYNNCTACMCYSCPAHFPCVLVLFSSKSAVTARPQYWKSIFYCFILPLQPAHKQPQVIYSTYSEAKELSFFPRTQDSSTTANSNTSNCTRYRKWTNVRLKVFTAYKTIITLDMPKCYSRFPSKNDTRFSVFLPWHSWWWWGD